VRSLGNGLDSSLYRFYKNDLQNKTFSKNEIKEFFAYFFMQWSAIGNYWGQPFYLAGTNQDGSTKVNELTYLIIEVYSELKIYNPKIQIKYNSNFPTDLLNKILSEIRKNNGSYVFCCEQGMRKAIMNYGATATEAREFDIRGCYETGVKGNEVSTVGGYINMLKAVEYVFSNGYDKNMGKQIGIQTGDVSSFTTFEQFYDAYIKQISYVIDETLTIVGELEKYLGFLNPSSLYSATIEHSLKQGKDAYQNGVKFNNSAELCCGFATAVDALMATYELVFEKKETTMAELKNALDNNWLGYEKLQLKAKSCKHKYGNNDMLADKYAAALAHFFAMKVGNKPNSRGGVYKPIMHTAMQFVWEGKQTLATPDGRNATDEMSKNASPSIGADKNGATALILSSLKLNPPMFTESFCLDIMLHPSAVEGSDGLIAMKGLLDVYANNDGQSLQFNVFNSDILKDAQSHPEKYPNLQVRVCGWNVLWKNLPKAEQEAYIKRAETNGNQ
jgi:formate C-acetyltransferase